MRPTVLEEEWFATIVDGLPPVEGPAGPFHKVTSELSQLTQGRLQLLLTVIASVHASASKTGDLRIDHDIAALVLWPINAGGRAHMKVASIDEAVDVVVQRALGTPETPNHGGRWWMVGPVTVEFPPPVQLLAAGDPLTAAGAANVRSCRYTVTEMTSA